MKACIMGLGRAGLPLAAVVANAGMQVIGYDIDKTKAKLINQGLNPIPEEDGLDKIVKTQGGKKLLATTNLEDTRDCNVYVVIVPLFLDKNNKPDFSIIDEVFGNVAKVVDDGDLVVLETTVPPKTTETRIKKILDKSKKKYLLAYSPERIMTGYSISRFQEFPKVVGGVTPKATDAAYKFYSQFNKEVIKVKDSRTAELVKVSEGVFRDVNIALANQLFLVAENLDVDFWEMREAAWHQFCSIHEPGMVGGHCIPVYPYFLINEQQVPLIECARKMNDSMVKTYAQKAIKLAGKKKKIGIIGLSYRKGVKEAVHTKTHDLIRELKDNGCQVYGKDENFSDEEVQTLFKITPLEKYEDMGALILANKIDKGKPPKAKTVDVKNQLK